MEKSSFKALAIIGSRTVHPEETFNQVLAWLKANIELEAISTIVSGGARGADEVAEALARHLGIDLVVFPPEYKRYGRRGPFVRNQQIAEAADTCLAVVDKPLSESKGTADCVRRFQKLGKSVWVLQIRSSLNGDAFEQGPGFLAY